MMDAQSRCVVRITSAAYEVAGKLWLWCVRYLMKMKFWEQIFLQALFSLSYKIPAKPPGFKLLPRSGSCSISILSLFQLEEWFSPSPLVCTHPKASVLLTHHRVKVLQESHVPIIHTKWIRWGMKRAWKGKARSKFSFLNVSTRQLLASVMILMKKWVVIPGV